MHFAQESILGAVAIGYLRTHLQAVFGQGIYSILPADDPRIVNVHFIPGKNKYQAFVEVFVGHCATGDSPNSTPLCPAGMVTNMLSQKKTVKEQEQHDQDQHFYHIGPIYLFLSLVCQAFGPIFFSSKTILSSFLYAALQGKQPYSYLTAIRTNDRTSSLDNSRIIPS